MMFDQTPDTAFPALSTLTATDLQRITGAPSVEVLRFRHQPGTRAVLHVRICPEAGAPLDRREGAIWFLWPDKAERLCRSHPGMQHDPQSGAIFEPFPQDHRLPEVARFLAEAPDLAPALMGGPARGTPRLMRYRPGLSATFRWQTAAGTAHFIKVARKARVSEQAAIVTALHRQLDGCRLGVAPVSGLSADHAAIAYRGAEGIPFDHLFQTASPDALAAQTADLITALTDLWCSHLPDLPPLGADDYLHRATRSADIIAAADAPSGQAARALLHHLARTAPPLRFVPIHTDMKPDHAFASADRITLIDTESLHLGDPDYDLALLDARLDIGLAEGWLDAGRCQRIRHVIRQAGGPHYGWFLALGTIHAAKYFAQRTRPDRTALLRGLLPT